VTSRPIPTPSLVVLIGPPGSGKSTWAAEHFDARQIVGTDALRGVVGEHELDLAATDDAFELLDRIVGLRLGRGLTTVVDGTGLDPVRRAAYLEAAAHHRVAAIAVRFTTSAAECRRRNRERDHPVPAKALDRMLAAARSLDLGGEPWDLVLEPEPVRTVTPRLGAALAATADDAARDPTADGLRFGLLVSSFDWPGGTGSIGPTLARIAADAERAGFDSLWVMDHVLQLPQLGPVWDPMLESYATLSFLAAATERIRLGVLVSAVTFRNVGHLAKAIATLDVLSGGRAIAGLGAGSSEREHVAYGWRFPPARERLALLEDTLQALPVLWGPGSRPFEGRVVTIPDTTCYPRPLQDPVPIVVGGSGERVTLRLAARYASGCNLFGGPAAVGRRVVVVREHCRALGRDPDDLEITHLGSLLLGRDPPDLRDRVERLRPANQGPQRFAATVHAGTVDDHEAGFRELAAVGVRTAIVSTPDLHDPTTLPTFGELIARFRR
jgi:F420-dependent oxidoreductase-like protein